MEQNPEGQQGGEEIKQEGVEEVKPVPEEAQQEGRFSRFKGLFSNLQNVDYARPFRWTGEQFSHSSIGAGLSNFYQSHQKGVEHGFIAATAGASLICLASYLAPQAYDYFLRHKPAAVSPTAVTMAFQTQVPATPTLEAVVTRASPTVLPTIESTIEAKLITPTPTLESTPTQAPTPAYPATPRATIPATIVPTYTVAPQVTKVPTRPALTATLRAPSGRVEVSYNTVRTAIQSPDNLGIISRALANGQSPTRGRGLETNSPADIAAGLMNYFDGNPSNVEATGFVIDYRQSMVTIPLNVKDKNGNPLELTVMNLHDADLYAIATRLGVR